MLSQKYDAIGDIRGGHGLMAAVEAVSDPAKKAPASGGMMSTIFETAYAAGVMLRISGPNIILSPPLVVTEQDVSDILSAIDTGFAALN